MSLDLIIRNIWVLHPFSTRDLGFWPTGRILPRSGTSFASRVETGIFRRKRDKNPPVMFSQCVADKRDCQRGECPFAG
jgi:hypothetical protein